MSDDPVFNEPIKTGWLRTIVGGDIAHAKTYLLEARKMLGHLRIINGVNDRLAAGEPGGYFKGSKTMPDGTRIEVYTNNGHDALTIVAPQPEERARSESWQHATTGEAHASVSPVVPGYAHTPNPTPVPVLVQKREEDNSEEEKKEENPLYMWVGVRVKYDECTMPYYACLPIMIEPDGDKQKYRGVVQDSSGSGWANFFDIQWDAQGNAVSAQYAGGGGNTEPYSDIDGALADFHDNWGGSGQPRKRWKDHCLFCNDYGSGENFDNGSGGFFFSANGLRLYSAVSFEANVMDGYQLHHSFPPYDPLMTDAENAGEGRSFGGQLRGTNPVEQLPHYGWDATFVLDPNETDGDTPVDVRPKTLAASAYLQSVGMVSGEPQVLFGEYLLSVMCYEESGDFASTRTGQVIPGWENYTADGLRRGRNGDYMAYMAPLGKAHWPMVCDIEIRLGKGAYMQTWNYEVTVADGSVQDAETIPFGLFDESFWTSCNPHIGWNAFGPNYSHPFIGIDVRSGSVRLVDGDAQPVLGGGHFSHDGDPRRELDLYFFADYFPQPDRESFPKLGGAALHIALEGISSGTFGESFVNEFSQAALEGALGSYDPRNTVFRMNGRTGIIETLPVISRVEDYDYSDWIDEQGNKQPSWFHPSLYWYYPYLLQSKSACRNVFAVVIFSTGQPYLNGDQDYSRLGPIVTCC